MSGLGLGLIEESRVLEGWGWASKESKWCERASVVDGRAVEAEVKCRVDYTVE